LPEPRAVVQTGSMIEEPAVYPWLTGRQNLQVLVNANRRSAWLRPMDAGLW
jgi:ABC-type multidrug transport system ATPase subunit